MRVLPDAPLSPIRLGFLNLEGLGHVTLGANLRAAFTALGESKGVCTHARSTLLWRAGGTYERIEVSPRFPDRLRGQLSVLRAGVRGRQDVAGLLKAERCDVLLINPQNVAAFAGKVMTRIPTILMSDATPIQMNSLDDYGGPSDSKVVETLKHAANVRKYNAAAGLVALSHWTAQSMINDYGVDPARVHVIPPGVDTEAWHPGPARRDGAKLQVLFVGGDFARKGGWLLLDVFRDALRRSCDLHLVTKADVADEPGVHVYREFGPNDLGLRRLYERCDVLVLPTRADCFSWVAIEAMACGLPVVSCPVGGIPDIVRHEETGFLMSPDDGRSLAESVLALASSPARRRQMGKAGRRLVEERFDLRRNAGRILDLVVRAARERSGAAPMQMQLSHFPPQH